MTTRTAAEADDVCFNLYDVYQDKLAASRDEDGVEMAARTRGSMGNWESEV
jgi:hypothetical protein